MELAKHISVTEETLSMDLRYHEELRAFFNPHSRAFEYLTPHQKRTFIASFYPSHCF